MFGLASSTNNANKNAYIVKLNKSYSYTWPTLPSMLTARKRMHCCRHMQFHIIFPYHADTRHASYPSKQTSSHPDMKEMCSSVIFCTF